MPDTKTPPPTDNTIRPIPPRYWWLKRILLATGVLILALAALRLWWGWEAERRLEAKIAEYRAAGQPVTIEDFQFPPVPDEENAAVFYRRAAAAMVITAPPGSRVSAVDVGSEGDDPTVWAEYADDIALVIEANAEALQLIRHARGMPRANWNIQVSQAGFAAAFPEFSAQRGVATLLTAAADYQHRRGNHAETVSTMRDALAHSKDFGQMRGFSVTHLVLVAIDALATTNMESVIPTLAVSGEPGTDEPGSTPARREQVHALIEELLDERFLRDSWRWAMYGGRLRTLENTRMAMSGTGGLGALGGPALPNPITFALRPMFQLDAVFMLDCYTRMLDTGLPEDYPTAESVVVRYPRFRSGIERNAHVLSTISLPSMERTHRGLFRALARRRMAVTALAIRLFELDDGKRPSLLDQLVPEYLSEVPLDPFAADRRPLGYLPDAPKPRLYSVGFDGKDDLGAFPLREDGGLKWPPPDLLYFLDGDRPRAPSWLLTRQPSTSQAVEDEGEEVGDGGQSDQDKPAADEP